MAGEGAAQFGPLHQCSWKSGALVLERGPVMTLGVEEGPVMKEGSSTKRKAEVAALPTEDRPFVGLLTKRKAEEPAAGCFKGEKRVDVVAAAAAGGEDEAVKTAAGKAPTAAGMNLRAGLVVDDELLEHLEWVKSLNLPPLESLIPGLVFSNRRSDFYNESSDEEEEEGEEVVQERNAK